MIYAIVGGIICVLLATLFIVVRVRRGGMIALNLKTLASIGFVVLGATMFFVINTFSWKSVFVILGLICGLAGDVLLDFKVVKKEKSDLFLALGMGAFGLGHAFYFTYIMLAIVEFSWLFLLISILSAILVVLVVVLVAKPIMKLDFGKFLWPTIAYTFILSFVMVFAICSAVVQPALWILALGLGLIFLSDLVLSQMYFGGKQDDKLLCIINHGIYYLGQIAIAISCLTLIV